MSFYEVHLPFPPSVNNYYVKTRRGVFISGKGRQYRTLVEEAVREQLPDVYLRDKLLVQVILFMPDRRKRDIDNYNKSMLDAISKAGLWEDDVLIDQLHLYRGAVIKGGSAVVRISEAGPLIPIGGEDLLD